MVSVIDAQQKELERLRKLETAVKKIFNDEGSDPVDDRQNTDFKTPPLSLCLSLALSTPKPGMEASCEERVESSPYFVKKFLLLRRLPIYLNCMVVAKERDCCHFVLYTQATDIRGHLARKLQKRRRIL